MESSSSASCRLPKIFATMATTNQNNRAGLISIMHGLLCHFAVPKIECSWKSKFTKNMNSLAIGHHIQRKSVELHRVRRTEVVFHVSSNTYNTLTKLCLRKFCFWRPLLYFSIHLSQFYVISKNSILILNPKKLITYAKLSKEVD